MSDEKLGDLVEQCRSGDMEAFGDLVRRFQDMAHGYAYSILGDFDQAEGAALEEAKEMASNMPDPAQAAERPEMQERVLDALRFPWVGY